MYLREKHVEAIIEDLEEVMDKIYKDKIDVALVDIRRIRHYLRSRDASFIITRKPRLRDRIKNIRIRNSDEYFSNFDSLLWFLWKK